MPDPNSESDTDSDSDSEFTWTVGDTVRDRDDDDPDPAIVVNAPDVRADEWTVPHIQTTVAEDNSKYPVDAPVVVVVFKDTLEESFPEWERDNPIPITDLNDAGVKHYSFPTPRLAPFKPAAITTTDADADRAGDSSLTDVTTSSSSFRTDENEDKDMDQSYTSAASDPDSDSTTDTSTSIEDSTTQPAAAVRTLKQRLENGGMTTEVEADGQTIRTTKLGETYRVRPGEILDGDGALRSRLEDIVTSVDQQARN